MQALAWNLVRMEALAWNLVCMPTRMLPQSHTIEAFTLCIVSCARMHKQTYRQTKVQINTDTYMQTLAQIITETYRQRLSQGYKT